MKFLKCINVELKGKCIDFLKEESIVITDDAIEEETRDEINKAIEKLDAPVFIKLNECAPTDCKFLIHELKCFNINDILTLLKGSEKVYEVLMSAVETGQKINLKLMSWYRIDMKNEYRCFFYNGGLRGVSQRFIEYFFNYENDYIDHIGDEIKKYFEKEKLSDTDLIIVDLVYISDGKLKVLDIISNTRRKEINLDYYRDDYFLLFSEEEIVCDNDSYEIRVVNSPDEVVTTENLNKYPIELVESNFDINDLISKNL
jgi:hypothetical protein